MGKFNKLPLTDKHGNKFVFCPTNEIQRKTHWLDMRAAGSIITDNPITDNDIRDTYIIKSLIEEAISSSQLEGATTTRRVAKEMIRQGRKPRDKSEQMILNNYHAMDFIREFDEYELSPKIIFELHKILTEDTLDDPEKAGVFRTNEDKVYVTARDGFNVLHWPPNADELAKRMEAFCRFANASQTSEESFIHPVLRAIVVHFMLAYEHPFVDGNGRTARALFYWMMIKQGYWLAEFISISTIIKKFQTSYGKAFLYTETDNGDVTYFIINQLEIIEKAITNLHNYLNKRAADIEHVEKILSKSKGVSKNLNFRQLALLRHALKHSRSIYTIVEHRKSHNVSYETARKDLTQLSDKFGLLEKVKKGREYLFISPIDFEERIKE